MEHESNSFQHQPGPDDDRSRPDEWIAKTRQAREPGLPLESEDEIEAALAEADADVAAGHVVSHEEVAKWLATWGTPDERPAPREWFE